MSSSVVHFVNRVTPANIISGTAVGVRLIMGETVGSGYNFLTIAAGSPPPPSSGAWTSVTSTLNEKVKNPPHTYIVGLNIYGINLNGATRAKITGLCIRANGYLMVDNQDYQCDIDPNIYTNTVSIRFSTPYAVSKNSNTSLSFYNNDSTAQLKIDLS